MRLEEVSTTCSSGWVNDRYAKLLLILTPDVWPTYRRCYWPSKCDTWLSSKASCDQPKWAVDRATALCTKSAS